MSDSTGASPPDSLAELTIGTKRIYEGNIINVRVDTVRMPSGRDATREIVEHSHAVCIVPIDNDCLLYTSPSPRDGLLSRMPSSA